MKSTLRNAINARIPELLELKAKCEVRVWERIYELDWGYYWEPPFQYYCSGDDSVEAWKFEILWTPPSWSDYLRCLGEGWWIDWDGYILKKYWNEWDAKPNVFSPYIEWKIICECDLTRSPLEQSDETLQKLVDLITL